MSQESAEWAEPGMDVRASMRILGARRFMWWLSPLALAVVAWFAALEEPMRVAALREGERSLGQESALAGLEKRLELRRLRNEETSAQIGTCVSETASPMLAVERVADIARAHRLTGISYDVAEADRRKHVAAVPLVIRLRGSFADAVAFMEDAEESPVRPIARRIELQRALEQNGVTLILEFLVLHRLNDRPED